MGHAYALAIGISRYRHISPLPDVLDAQDVHEVLHDPAIGACTLPALPPMLDEAATKAAIVDVLTDLARCTDPSSTVFFYFSGHGGRATVRGEDTCFLMPVDGDASSTDALERTAISGKDLSELLRAIPAARLTVVLDCCRASDLAEPKDVVMPLAPQLTSASLSPLAAGRGRAVFAASRADGYAFVVPGQRNGVFTGYLLAGLRGEAESVGGVIRVCDLFHYVQQRVIAHGRAQRPVFKAELEENYVVAHARGRTVPEFQLPRPPDQDGFEYDAFVSYCREDTIDRSWVGKVMVPRLERLGLKLCLEHRNFRLGIARIREMERAIARSRYTVAVFTPAYLDGAFQDFESLLAQHYAIKTRAPRFIPLLRRDCRLDLAVEMTEMLDASSSDDAEVDAALQRLAVALREPPRPRLNAGG